MINKLNTSDLRKAANAIYLAVEFLVAEDTAKKLNDSADVIDELRSNICKHWDYEEKECGD